jgi:hypothetical protein
VKPIEKVEDVFNFSYTKITSVLVILPNSLLNLYKLMKLRQQENVVVGILPMEKVGQVKEKLTRYKKLDLYEENLIIDRINKGGSYKDGRVKVFSEGSIDDFQQTLSLLRDTYSSICLTSHGRGDVIYLPHAILCGKKESAVNTVPDGEFNLPHCHFTGECFYKGREIIKVQQLQYNFLFLNSCSSLNGREGLFNESYAIDQSLLSGKDSLAVIGSPMNRYGNHEQSLMFTYLLNEGLKLSSILNLIEDTVETVELEFKTLLIYGDPQLRTPRSLENIEIINIDKETRGLLSTKDHNKIHLITSDFSEDETIYIDGKDVSVLRTRIGFFVIPIKGEYSNESYKWERVNRSELFKSIIEINQGVSLFKNLRLYGMKINESPGKLKELESRSTGLEREYLKFLKSNEGSYYKKITKNIKRINSELNIKRDLIVKGLIDSSHKSNLHFYENYRYECLLEDFIVSDGKCPYCDNEIMISKWKHPLKERFSRTLKQCYRCGYLSDTPKTEKSSFAKIVTQSPLKVGESSKVTVSFEEEINGDVILAVVLMDIAKFGIEEPIYDTKFLSFTNQKDFHFNLDIPKDLPLHHYWLRVYMLQSGNISSFYTNIWLKS